MNKQVKEAILQKIEAYQRIIITRHARPDGDAIGSTKGLRRILHLTYPEKEILLINEDSSEYLAFLGGEDAPIEEDQYRDALMIVLDTGNRERISNKKYALGKELIKIDHHIDHTPYGDLSWVEEERSSACEMVVDFYMSFRDRLRIDREAAAYLYTGMVTDSGRFQYEAVSAETLRCAAVLLEQGIDTQTLFAQLYLKNYEYMKFQAYVYKKMRMTENGVAYLLVNKSMQRRFSLSSEDASACVSFMDSIRGSIIWLAFIENKDKSIRVRLRSRFVTVNQLAEKYHGGGHACAAGATVYSKKEMEALLADADKLIAEYKKTHEDWL